MSTLTEASLAINSLFCETNTEERIYLKHIYSLAYGQNQLNKVIIWNRNLRYVQVNK